MDTSALASPASGREIGGPEPRDRARPCPAPALPAAGLYALRTTLEPARPGEALWRRRVGGRSRAAQPGQATVEFAIVGVVALIFGMVAIQYGLLVAQQYGASYVARETVRWLAVRIDSIDSQVTTYATDKGAPLPGLGGTGMGTVSVAPSCAALTAGKCAGRASGDAITVTVNYNPSRVMFLPTTFGVAPWQATFPVGATSARASVMLE